MNNPLPLSFAHGFSDPQLAWHWAYFKQSAEILRINISHTDDAQFSWEAYIMGAYAEKQRDLTIT